ncbi:hypothetical protein M0R88_11755 [Halorussus gelatinilyticus]|uniref:Uncharacterized protein n=1 Tax=Halorussus gelatinilyticus TaxID=2937524 RepID=A0A8U0IDR8_9EURY|nr:hypothetical protein [Halorussus gelatinilyticus]UPV99199.1 hypothetical protein M0R88_11755 [Halorussus gelatinilyticus]
MGLTKSLLRGIVAFVVAALVARAFGGNGTKIGLLTGGSVAVTTWLFGRDDSTEIEFEDEVVAE